MRFYNLITTSPDPTESIYRPLPQKRYRAIKKVCYYRNRILYCHRVDKSHLTKQPERLCLDLFGFMAKQRRNIRDVFFPLASVFFQNTKFFIEFFRPFIFDLNSHVFPPLVIEPLRNLRM